MEEEFEKLKPIPFIRELCVGKPENELLEAEENFREYILLVKEICDRIEFECHQELIDEN